MKAKMNDYLSRKFLLAVIAGTMATALQWWGKLDAAGSTYALIIVGTIGAYIAGNVVEAKNERV